MSDWRVWLAVAAATVFMLVTGLPLGDALVVGLGVLVIGLVVTRLDDADDVAWPPPPPHPAHGRRVDVAALTWSLAGRDGRVAEPALRRLREIACRRLARVGLPLSAGFVGPTDAAGQAERDAARALLGDRAWATLASPDGRLPGPADVAVCVRALEDALTREEIR